MPDFVLRFATPIVRVSARAGRVGFFSLQEYDLWKAPHPDEAGAAVKYYKGLGTSTNRDAKEYFTQWDAHVTRVEYRGAPCDAAMRMFFDERLAAERKAFLSTRYSPLSYVDYAQDATSMHDFLHDEMAHFSHADNVRSIPSALDGLKPVQRKVLFTLFDRSQRGEVKVAQAAAMVAERTAYHHGEVSVAEAIVGLAQDHVGTNNVALLWPEGQFGSRHNKPSEHAAVRYILTRLDLSARRLFRPEDDPVLEHALDDGQRVEPRLFVPVIPMVLVNGAAGIGTGWSTNVPSFNPHDVVQHCLALAAALRAGAPTPRARLTPWFAGFTGRVTHEAAAPP